METLKRYVREHRSEFVAQLLEYAAIPSVSTQADHRSDLQACADWIRKHCEGLGLDARLEKTEGNPIVIARTPRSRGSKKPHFLVYGHYDVQPPEPLELWKTPPFEPRVENGAIYARGVSDNKGQHFAHLKAVEAYARAGEELPCDLTFVIEGEEEIGSASLPKFLERKRAALKCDAVVVSDTGMPSPKHPALTYGLRGVAALEVRVHGPSRDLHSGIFGGTVDNPAMVLCQALAQLRDKKGRVAIPGFYDDVLPLSKMERKEMAKLPFSEASYRKFLGVRELFGERGHTVLEQRSSRPTLEINGLTSGYQGEGTKTIIPAWASAKLTFRLVPNQKPDRILKAAARHIRSLCPPTVRVETVSGHGGEPYLMSPTSPLAQAALRALGKAFDRDPMLMREGGSIPIVNEFKRILGVDTLLVGLALPDDNAHSPNEKFSLDMFEKGIQLGLHLWPELAAAKKR